MRGAIRDLGLVPDLILVSSARRTLETLAALEPWDNPPIVRNLDALYLASAAQFLATLRDVPETVNTVLAIGHNPGIHDLALALASSSSGQAMADLQGGFPTAGLAGFTIAGPWSGLGAGGGRLVRFLTPRALGDTGL